MAFRSAKTLTALPLAAALLASSALTAIADDHATKVKIGETTALVAEASTPGDGFDIVDGQSADIDFPFIGRMKALATVGEVDAETGMALTGWPDGNAAWLKDEDTVRLGYQSESYATMSTETYPWEMKSGVTFTGSHLHYIDYTRAALADFLNNDSAASEMVEGSGHQFHTIYNVFGDEVKPRAEGGVWGNQSTPEGEVVEFAPDYVLQKADFFFQSFCGAYYEPANKYGDGIGFADDAWMMAEEWNISRMFNAGDRDNPDMIWDTHDGMGLASIVVDLANETAYTVPALGQSGYEKIMPINPQNPNYVVLVLAGYNHNVEPAPLKIYVGLKGADVDGSPIAADAPERDQFLARNGLLHGKIYGVAVANETFADLGIDEVDPAAKLMDAYITNPDAVDDFAVAFVPTSFQWGGWDNPVAVKDTEINLWQKADEQPAGHTFLNGDSKTEHPAVDPNPDNTRWIQSLTHEGGYIAFALDNIAAELEAANGALPDMLTGTATRTLAAFDGALTLEIGEKGIKHGGMGTHETDEDGVAKATQPDGLMWIKGSDADVLIVNEDSGNAFGERAYALVVDPATMQLTEPGKGYFLAMAGGDESPRAKAGATALAGAIDKPRTSEFSGSWDITALLARKDDGSFYTMDELAGMGEQAVNRAIPTAEHVMMGVVQHRTKSGGQVADVEADRGGQIFMFNLNLPQEAFDVSALQ
ncbi:MAG: calcium-binding protein [Pseudomonadota bacterium]